MRPGRCFVQNLIKERKLDWENKLGPVVSCLSAAWYRLFVVGMEACEGGLMGWW